MPTDYLDYSGAVDRGFGHSHPAVDYLTGFTPRSLKDLFKWSEYLCYNSSHIYAALKKFGDLIVTNFEYDTQNDQLAQNYRELYTRYLKIKTVLLMANFDGHVYGNSFMSIYKPFIRNLKCVSCSNLTNIESISDYSYDWKTLKFKYFCIHCQGKTTGTISDVKAFNVKKMRVILWDPKTIDIDYNPISGSSVYYHNLEDKFIDGIKEGKPHIINSTPVEFLEVIKEKSIFKFQPDAIFHSKAGGPSGIDQAWGLPPLAATLKLFLNSMILRKANEAIALEHIVPFRVMFPGASGSMDPIMQYANMAQWREEMEQGIKDFRKDPLHITFSPINVGVARVGGDGRAMLTLGEIQEADKGILAAMGVPLEFLYGGLTKAGMDGTIRLIENQLQKQADNLNDSLAWITETLAKYLSWEKINVKLTPLSLIDDMEKKQMVVGLATGQLGPQLVSMSTVAGQLDINLEDERRKRLQETVREAKFQQEVKREVEKVQNSLVEQVQTQASSGSGLTYDQQAVIAKADEMAQQMTGLDPSMRKSQLHALQTEDYVMYSVVIQRMEQMKNEQMQQIKQQMG